MVASKFVALAATAFLAATVNAQADPIVIKGSKFFYKTNGSQFYIRGVDYQQNPNAASSTTTTINDPLADSAGCKRDLPYLQQLRTNTVRVYAIDPTQSHDDCMNLFASNGIYVVADLSAPQESINRNDPSWNLDLYARYTSVVDLMAKYTNTLGFFAGNEVANMVNNTNAMPFVKAAVRDIKTYIKSKNYRALGVGYAATDDATIRDGVRPYMVCGSTDTSVDFFGYNIYEWCSSKDTYSTSGYKDRTAEFANYPVPPFFAEYGCNQVTPRTFPDTQPLFSSPMSDVWSGGLVYEYFQDTNDFGLVTISGSSVTTLAPFAAYSSQVAKVNPSGVSMNAYTPTNTALPSCPTTGSSWNGSSTLPPSPNNDLCACAVSNSTCVANSNVNTNAIGELLDYICGNDPNACGPISRDGAKGKYGAFSMCSAKQQLSIAMNAYYIDQGSNSQACDFGGNATVQTASIGSCSSSLQQAGGAFGTGTVTGGPSGSSSSSAASNSVLPPFDFGILAVGVYTVVAFISGAGLLLL